jgi:hypothetical protein
VSDALKAIKGLNPSLRNALSSFLIHDIASSSFFAFAGIYVLAESELLIKALSSWKTASKSCLLMMSFGYLTLNAIIISLITSGLINGKIFLKLASKLRADVKPVLLGSAIL